MSGYRCVFELNKPLHTEHFKTAAAYHMSKVRECPKCGSELVAGAVLGVCPTCVEQAGADWLLEESRGRAGSATRGDSGPSREGQPIASEGHPFGPYELLEEIGRGGMGVVYRATDPRLDRAVAIKALPAELATDAGRLARFEIEARTLASLNHPNVAGIHGLEEQDGQRYLVLELVEGETLAELLSRGRLPLDQVLTIAQQMASGLQAAHEATLAKQREALAEAEPVATAERQRAAAEQQSQQAVPAGGAVSSAGALASKRPKCEVPDDDALLDRALRTAGFEGCPSEDPAVKRYILVQANLRAAQPY